MSSENNDIFIPIEQSTNATSSFNTNNLFQQEALCKIKKLISKNIKDSNNYKFPNESHKFDRYHNAITILGERGTGKTSFLLNLKKSCDKKDDFIFLDTLDPTLFEDKQNILVSIISLIADKVKNTKKENDEWIKCLTKLSDGLNLLDGIGSNPMQKDIWDDSRIILDKGLSSAHSGINFEKNLHEFIDKSLQLLNNKALFILRFDDIDTSVLKGWPVLEVIRKYLTTPKIQIIISGDINLFSKLVRLKQWENLEKLTKFERKKSLEGTIDQLEEQYLTKILKPENRIYLQSLESILKRKPHSIKIEYKNDNELIENIYNDIAEKVFLLERKRDKSTFLNILLKLPIRTNIQILMAYYNSLYDSHNNERFLDDFALIFMTNFTKFNFKYEDTFTLASHNEEVISYLIDKLIYIKNYNKLTSIKDLKSLQPKFEDKDLNLFLLFLNANVVNTMSKSVSIIFDWYLKKFYLFKILEEFEGNENYKENDVINYLDVTSSLINISSRLNGILYNNDKKGYDNFAKVYMQKRQVKDGGFGYDKYLELLKNDLEKTYPYVHKTFFILHNIIFSKVRAKNESGTYLHTSILNIFSFIGSILNFSSDNTFEDNIKSILYDKTINSFIEDKYGDIASEQIEENIESLILFKELEKWVNYKDRVQPFSVQLIEDVWNEFYEREILITNVNRVGEYLELQIFVFLNALFKTIKIHQNVNSSTRLIKSISQAKKRFFDNIKGTKYEKIKDVNLNEKNRKIDFLEYMLLCPLWKYIINLPESEEFIFELISIRENDSPNSYADYFNLLSLHQGNIDQKDIEEENVIEVELVEKVINKGENKIVDEDESTWPNSKLSDKRIKETITKYLINLNDKHAVDLIWNYAKQDYLIKGTIDYKGRNIRIQEIVDELKNSHE